MKGKISLLILTILLAGTLVFAASYNIKYYTNVDGEIVSIRGIFNFLSDINNNETAGKNLFYDSSLNSSLATELGKYFGMKVIGMSPTATTSFYNPGNFTIILGTNKARFIDPQIRNMTKNFDAVLLLDSSAKEILYVVVSNSSVLDSLIINLENYAAFQDMLDENLIYYSASSGFIRFLITECYQENESDRTNPDLYGCVKGTSLGDMCDYCQTSKVLLETSCENNTLYISSKDCSLGCSNGACNQCEEKWLDKYNCVYSMFNPRGYVLQRQYQWLRYGKCTTTWKNYQKCNGKCLTNAGGASCQKGGQLISQPVIATRAISESSNFNIFSKIAGFFRNLF